MDDPSTVVVSCSVTHLIGSLPAFNLALSRYEQNVEFAALGAYLLLDMLQKVMHTNIAIFTCVFP